MITVTVLQNGIKSVSASKGARLLDVLREHGFMISAACGGFGRCGKCRVKIVKGVVEGASADKEGFVLACKATIVGDVTVELPLQKGVGLTDYVPKDSPRDGKKGLGAAVDIGTTTIAAAIVDLQTGAVLERESELNAQSPYGADVVSRISAARDSLATLKGVIRKQVNSLLNRMMRGEKQLAEVVIVGNTTMLHIFAGENPEGIGKYPFTPVFTGERLYRGFEVELNAEKVTLMPSVSAYVGADVVAGLLTLPWSDDRYSLYLDLGTNGETVLFGKNRAVCTSTAAGPAFEGASIECGTGGVNGAINSVKQLNGKASCTTIGGTSPLGICGAGLVDAVAVMLELGVIDSSGAFSGEDNKFYLAESVYVSQKDVRQLQLAKSAVCSGVTTLLLEEGISVKDIEKVYVAGGVGFYINKDSAQRIGLLKKEICSITETVGNAALSGAIFALLSDDNIKKATKTARLCSTLELSNTKAFADEFINNLEFC